MLFGNKSQPLLGLDITTSSVKLIELSQSGKRYRVESYSAEPTPPSSVSEKAIVDAKAVGEAIRRAVKRAGAKATDVAVAISGDAAITKVIQMPSSLSERDLEGQVEIQADQYIPFPMEEVSFDYEVIGPNDKDPELLTCCSLRHVQRTSNNGRVRSMPRALPRKSSMSRHSHWKMPAAC